MIKNCRLEIPNQQEFTLDIFNAWEFRSHMMIYGRPVLWCQVDTTESEKTYSFYVYVDEEEISNIENITYLGSYLIGSHTKHVYVNKESREISVPIQQKHPDSNLAYALVS
jgi:hypothetical protein